MHFYANGRKMECFAQDFSVPFDASNVEESENVPGKFYVYGEPNADGETPWRWLTAEEQDQYDASHEYHRHDDDGHGMAIGATKLPDGGGFEDTNEDDLGPKWGSVAEEQPNPIMDAYKNNEAHRVESTDALAEIPNLIATAKAVLDEVAADPLNTRFILLKIPMEKVNADSTGTPTGDITQLGTIGSDFLVQYAQGLLMEQLFSQLADTDIGPAANKLEV